MIPQPPVEQIIEKKPLPENVWKDTNTFMDDMNYHQMAEQFDISYEDRKDQSLAEKLSYLTDWAKEQTKSEDKLQQQLAIKQLTKNLGYQFTGPELVKKLYMWTRLDQDRKRIEQKMELIK